MGVTNLLGSRSLVAEVTGVNESLKQCPKCSEWKELSAFSKGRKNKDGLQYWCKACKSAYNATLKDRPKAKIEEKICSQCGILKSIDQFALNQNTADGRLQYCKTCRKVNYNDKLKYKPKTEVTEKRCYNCGEIKSADDFYAHSNSRDGLQNICIDCRSVHDSQYTQTPQGKVVRKKSNHKRRLLSKDLPTDHLTNQLLRKRFRLINVMLFDHCCPYCGNRLEYDDAHLDHFIPISNFGTNEIENIIHCCQSCNSSKNGKYPYKWIMKKYIDERDIPFDPQLWQDITSPEWDMLVYKYKASY